jgi:hypothetical protein
MSAPCLAHTGTMLWPYLAVGAPLIVAGLIITKSARLAGVVIVVLGALILGNVREPAAVAACGPAGYTLSGTYQVDTTITTAQLPTVTLTSGSHHLVASWQGVTVSGGVSSATFYVTDLAIGPWSMEVVGPSDQNLVLQASTPDFITIGDANNGSPLDIRSAMPLSVPADDSIVTLSAQVAQ